MIRINDLSVIDSFDETVPGAAGYAEVYLKAVAKGVQGFGPPVTMRIDSIHAGGGRGSSELLCLVVAPTTKRLHRYESAHFAEDFGAALRIGWYQLGGEFAGGRDIGGLGFLTVGAATDVDVSEVTSIYESVHRYAVLPAIAQVRSVMARP
jgi:hypothetical protein